MSEIKTETNELQKIYQSILIGLPRVVLTFGAGHPFDLLKTRMQANPNIESWTLLTKEIYQTTGVKGFYTAGTTNFLRASLKDGYRSPLRGKLQATYDDHFSQSPYVSTTGLTSVSMAVADTIILGPLERVKVWLMTNYHKDKTLVNFFSDSKMPLHQNLFQGFRISLVRNVLSWATYYIPEQKIKEIIKRNTADYNKTYPAMPFATNLLAGSIGGLINGLCILPFDTIKTNIQKEGSIELATLKKMYQVGESLIREHGFFKGAYPGFVPKLIQYIIVGAITSDVIEKVDKVWQTPFKR